MRGPRSGTFLSPASLGGLAAGLAVAAACSYAEGRAEAVRDRRAATLLAAAHATQSLAAHVADCSDRGPADVPRSLPPASRAVPAAVPRGVAVSTTAADWADPAFECAGFRLFEPQAFQLRWATSWATGTYVRAGTATAAVDLDGDGLVDRILETDVACTADACTMGPGVTVEVR